MPNTRTPRRVLGGPELTDRLLSLIDRFSSRRLLVVGDLIADEFIYGEAARVSREAPVLILKYDATQVVPGGAGNAVSNVAALGTGAALAGLVGSDAEGRRLLASLPRSVDRRRVVRSPAYRTPVKTRILAGGIHSAKQQVVRIDRDIDWPVDADVSRTFATRLAASLGRFDAVLLSDYGSGLVTPALARVFRRYARSLLPRGSVPVLVDSRYRLTSYRALTACTPNESEVEEAVGFRIKNDARALERAGRHLLAQQRMRAVLITRGSRGMALFEPDRPTAHVPIFGSDEVADVTGAGDTVMATFGVALAAGASFYEAARLANYAGGLVVMKRGTATVSARELAEAVRSDADRAAVRSRPSTPSPAARRRGSSPW
ncbi:MAG: sugar kinase [Acidobacteria bacterium]|nr:sugar kinase [Acidobacteriota bacterium]